MNKLILGLVLVLFSFNANAQNKDTLHLACFPSPGLIGKTITINSENIDMNYYFNDGRIHNHKFSEYHKWFSSDKKRFKENDKYYVFYKNFIPFYKLNKNTLEFYSQLSSAKQQCIEGKVKVDKSKIEER